MVARCAEAARAREEPLAGTAPVEATWLVVEQEAPWGRDAVAESGLAAVAAHAAAAGAKVLLVRRPRRRGRRRAVFVARTGEHRFLRALEVERPDELLELDLARPEALGAPREAPLFLVCTNGRRDPCCATLGTAAARALRAELPEPTWECSHLGGHRFAATMLALPSGACFGRLGPPEALRAARSLLAGRLELDLLRGIAGRPAAAQSAEALLRARHGLDGLDDLRLLEERPDGEVAFAARDGRRLAVRLEPRELEVELPSCTGEPERRTLWVAAA